MIDVHTDNKETLYNALNRIAELESKIADIKANCDYVLEGKEVEYREERKKLCDEFENMKTGLESQIAELKDHLAEEVELHLHAEDYIKSLEQQIEKMKRHCNCKHRDGEGYCEVKRTYLMDLSYDGCDKWELED